MQGYFAFWACSGEVKGHLKHSPSIKWAAQSVPSGFSFVAIWYSQKILLIILVRIVILVYLRFSQIRDGEVGSGKGGSSKYSRSRMPLRHISQKEGVSYTILPTRLVMNRPSLPHARQQPGASE